MSPTPIPARANAPKASTFRFDLVAGLTAAAVVLPKAMAYASVAGLPVAVGLYTAFVPMAIYALLGTSRVLSVSSTTTIAHTPNGMLFSRKSSSTRLGSLTTIRAIDESVSSEMLRATT